MRRPDQGFRGGSLLAPIAEVPAGWVQKTPPKLGSQHKRVWCDSETTGLDFISDTAVGWSFYLEDGQKFYLPKDLAIPWINAELRDKDLVWINAKYDCHIALNTGISFEKLGNRLHDVAFQAALLRATALRFDLEPAAARRTRSPKLIRREGSKEPSLTCRVGPSRRTPSKTPRTCAT